MTYTFQKTAALLGALSLSLSLLVATANAQTPPGKEKCYGISKAGQDDGSKSAGPIPGMSTTDYQGDAYKFVTEGTCKAIMTPFGAGSTSPIKGRPPQ